MGKPEGWLSAVPAIQPSALFPTDLLPDNQVPAALTLAWVHFSNPSVMESEKARPSSPGPRPAEEQEAGVLAHLPLLLKIPPGLSVTPIRNVY